MRSITATLAMTVWIGVVPGVRAQWLSAPTPGIPRLPDGRPDLEAAVPRTLEGRPDLSGVWRRAANEPPRGSDLRSDIAEIPLLPAARELYERRIAASGAGVSSERCLPHGLPMEMMFRDTPFRIVQTPTLTVILLENMGRFRQVPWSVTIRLEFVPDTDLLEFVCENNKFRFKPAGQ